jgi:hypothetical protein
MNGTMSVELDWSASLEGLGSALFETTKDFESITYRIVSLEGPAGGAPIVRFEGTASDISDFVLEYCAGDREQAYELLMA